MRLKYISELPILGVPKSRAQGVHAKKPQKTKTNKQAKDNKIFSRGFQQYTKFKLHKIQNVQDTCHEKKKRNKKM